MIRTINVQTTGLFSQCNTICHPTHGIIPKTSAPPQNRHHRFRSTIELTHSRGLTSASLAMLLAGYGECAAKCSVRDVSLNSRFTRAVLMRA